MKPTKDTYDQLEKAYGYFNKALFANALPPCIITLHRKKGAFGYFWGDTWSSAEDGKKLTDEIALNPEHLSTRSLAEVLSTLVHEQCHLKQHHDGKPSRTGYHNKEWAGMMIAVGLIPSDTGEEGGKQTGQKVSHYIEDGGRFDVACEKLLATGFTIPWAARTRSDNPTSKKKRASKTKYTCPGCETNAWAKPETNLMCGDCEEVMEADE